MAVISIFYFLYRFFTDFDNRSKYIKKAVISVFILVVSVFCYH